MQNYELLKKYKKKGARKMTKDKLVKFHHKAPYYRFRKIAISFAALLGLSISVAVPVSITLTSVKAEEKTSSVTSSQNSNNKDTSTSEEQLSYLAS